MLHRSTLSTSLPSFPLLFLLHLCIFIHPSLSLSTHTLLPPCPTRPSPSKRVSHPVSSRSPASPTRFLHYRRPRALPTSLSTPHQCPVNTPRRVKQRCVPDLSRPSVPWELTKKSRLSQLKKALSNNVGTAQTLAYATSVSRSRRPSDHARAFRTETHMQPTTPHSQPQQGLMMKSSAVSFCYSTSGHALNFFFFHRLEQNYGPDGHTTHTTSHHIRFLVALGLWSSHTG